MAALHLDFQTAMRYLSSTSPLQKYKEDPNNIQVLHNTLKTLKEIKDASAGQMNENQLKEKIGSLLYFIKNMSSHMKNPYFKAFFNLL